MMLLLYIIVTVFLTNTVVHAQSQQGPHKPYNNKSVAAPGSNPLRARSNPQRACHRARRQGTLQPGAACPKEGVKCAWSTSTCLGQWDTATNACQDIVFTNTCGCEDGEWVCEMASCPRPDPRCD